MLLVQIYGDIYLSALMMIAIRSYEYRIHEYYGKFTERKVINISLRTFK